MEMRLDRSVSRGGYSAAVNNVFRAGDGSGARRGEEGGEVRYFPRPSRTSDRDAAERVHQDLAGTLVVNAFVSCQLVDQAHGGLCLDPARRNPYHANALRAHLLRQTLAVVREGGL